MLDKKEESHKCKICKKKEMDVILKIPYISDKEKKVQTIYKCNYCGFVSGIYDENKSFNETTSSADDKTFFLADLCYSNLNRHLQDIKTIIDINEGIGCILDKFKDCGKKCIGISIDAEADYDLINSYVENTKNTVLIVSDYLEHCKNPQHFFEFLKKSHIEKVYIQLPIYDYNIYNDIYGYFIKNHFSYFNRELIYNIMNSIGYELIEGCVNDGENFIMPMVFPTYVGIWEYNGKCDLIKRNSYIQLIDGYIDKCEKEIFRINTLLNDIDKEMPIAVWGTSNYAEKLLAMTDLKYKNIIYFYDNNKFKQGNFIYGRQIKEFDINDVRKKIIERIVIASNTVYKEIIEQLSRYDIVEKLVVLGN